MGLATGNAKGSCHCTVTGKNMVLITFTLPTRMKLAQLLQEKLEMMGTSLRASLDTVSAPGWQERYLFTDTGNVLSLTTSIQQTGLNWTRARMAGNLEESSVMCFQGLFQDKYYKL